MCDVGNRLMIYYEKLKRLRRHLDVIQQIHLSPQMYVNAVGEVVRRRTFSQAFLLVSSITHTLIVSVLCLKVIYYLNAFFCCCEVSVVYSNLHGVPNMGASCDSYWLVYHDQFLIPESWYRNTVRIRELKDL
jgi:hypothetical protein